MSPLPLAMWSAIFVGTGLGALCSYFDGHAESLQFWALFTMLNPVTLVALIVTSAELYELKYGKGTSK